MLSVNLMLPYFVMGAVIILLLINIWHLKAINPPEKIYIDKSGIGKNPPELFIDTWKNKTLNIKIDDKYYVSFCKLSILESLGHIENIATYYKVLEELSKYQPLNKVDEKVKYANIVKAYSAIIYYIYILTKPIVNKKYGFKKALYAKAEKDEGWLFDTCEQLFDYWMPLKKKLHLLARQQTLRQTVGERFTWNTLAMDREGRILIKPRSQNLLHTQN